MTTETSAKPAAKPKSFNGINHLKLPCQSLKHTMDFYTKVLPFEHMPQYDHFTPEHQLFARMAQFNGLIIEFRHVPDHAKAQKGWDPVTWGVDTRADLEEWAAWFDANDVKRSRIFTGIKGWVMGCEDPDGKIVRLYVDKEEHEWTDHPDQDEYWLGSVHGDPDFM
jgi:catechol-2,3-dioxygenase